MIIDIHPWTVSMHGLTGRARLKDGTPVPCLPRRDVWDGHLRFDVPDDGPLQVEYHRCIATGQGWRWAGVPAPACWKNDTHDAA